MLRHNGPMGKDGVGSCEQIGDEIGQTNLKEFAESRHPVHFSLCDIPVI